MLVPATQVGLWRWELIKTGNVGASASVDSYGLFIRLAARDSVE